MRVDNQTNYRNGLRSVGGLVHKLFLKKIHEENFYWFLFEFTTNITFLLTKNHALHQWFVKNSLWLIFHFFKKVMVQSQTILQHFYEWLLQHFYWTHLGPPII